MPTTNSPPPVWTIDPFPTTEQVVAALLAWSEQGPPVTYPEQCAAMRRALIAAASTGGLKL